MTRTSLRAFAINSTLFRPTTLQKAVDELGFIQADPIRSPARAQDLILRVRVKNYRAGDLEAKYAKLGLEEDYLYAYGFLTRPIWENLHPRLQTKLTVDERRVLEIVTAHKKIHPRDLEAYFGRARQVNDWGGYSKTTTRTLHRLHHRGLLRIAGRENGIRLYEAPGPAHAPAEPAERLRQLVLSIASILSPISDTSLRSTVTLFGNGSRHLPGRRSIVTNLIRNGDLASKVIDDVRYVWPSDQPIRETPVPDAVRFLAPFDPLVWDRRRFEHLWGWPYRFEAYTPPPKRKMGYYAMPMLWRDDVIGWVNVSNTKSAFKVEPGFVKAEPDSSDFRDAFDAEVESFRTFLN